MDSFNGLKHIAQSMLNVWWYRLFLCQLSICCMSGFLGVDAAFQQRLSFSVPSLTEEEEHSVHMPDSFKCDSCMAVAFQLKEAFQKAELKVSNKHKLHEFEIYDIAEKLCETGFEMYGMKNVEGKKKLSGPGLEFEKAAGVVQMGGKWPSRLRSLCTFYIGEIGEDRIYDVYSSNPDSLYSLLCNNKGQHSACHNEDPVVENVNEVNRIIVDEF